MGRVVVGTSGFAIARDRYFEMFRAVELLHTFDRLPSVATAERWLLGAPKDFAFTLYANKDVTFGPLDADLKRFVASDEVERAWRRTERFARALQARVVLLTWPEELAHNAENLAELERFFARRREALFRLAITSPPEWPREAIRRLCIRHALIHVVDPTRVEPTSPGPYYFRMWSPDRLGSAHLEKVAKLCAGDRDAFVFFSGTDRIDDAQRLAHLLEGSR